MRRCGSQSLLVSCSVPQTAPKYDVLFMDFGNREHVAAGQVRAVTACLRACPAGLLHLAWAVLAP